MKKNDFVITLGEHLASPEHFKSYDEAENAIKAVDWNLVASLAISLIEGMKKFENSKKEEDKQWYTIKITIMSKESWKEILRIIVAVLTALLTALGVQSCTATMSVFWKNANSQQKSEQSATNKVDSVNTNINLKK